MDDNCGEWVECMGVASGSGWNLWAWLLDVDIDFLILLIPTPLVSVQFTAAYTYMYICTFISVFKARQYN